MSQAIVEQVQSPSRSMVKGRRDGGELRHDKMPRSQIAQANLENRLHLVSSLFKIQMGR